MAHASPERCQTPPMKERENEQFAKNDPLRDLHVPRRHRLAEDVGGTANASAGGTDDEFDREAVKKRGSIVSEEDLQ